MQSLKMSYHILEINLSMFDEYFGYFGHKIIKPLQRAQNQENHVFVSLFYKLQNDFKPNIFIELNLRAK